MLYGGVSLAVYENGVAQELYRAFRGDRIYGLIREVIDSDIIVDVISGTQVSVHSSGWQSYGEHRSAARRIGGLDAPIVFFHHRLADAQS